MNCEKPLVSLAISAKKTKAGMHGFNLFPFIVR